MFGLNDIKGAQYFADLKDQEKLKVTSVFMTLQGEGPKRGMPAVFIRLTHCNFQCSWCFHGNTEITMADGGRKRIKDIAIGDMVMSWDEKEGCFKPGKVVETFKRPVEEILRVDAGGRPTFVTKEHPFLVKDKGWVEAGNLEVGDTLLRYTRSDRMTMFNPMKDKDVSAKVGRYNISSGSNLRFSKFMKELWKTAEFRNKKMDYIHNENPMKDPAVAAKGFRNRVHSKTSLEKQFEEKMSDMPIHYVGDAQLEIGYKFPDYVVDGQKKVIEVWAADSLFAKTRGEEWQNKRRSIFEDNGYEVLMLPIHSTKAEWEEIRNRVNEFIHNGNVVKSVTVIRKPESGVSRKSSNGKSWVRLADDMNSSVDVFNFEVENFHTYVANGNIVHNCDAFYDEGDVMTFDEIDALIDDRINEFFGGNVPEWAKDSNGFRQMGLVVTGGEPMLQDNLAQFLHLMEEQFDWTQIESNGRRLVKGIPDETILVVSPKCNDALSKDVKATKYLPIREEVLDRADALKFIMNSDPDSPYSSVPDWAFDWAENVGQKSSVYISPMNIYSRLPAKAVAIRDANVELDMEVRSTVDEVVSAWEPDLFDAKANEENHIHSAKYAVLNGFTWQMQLHLYAAMA